jgi:hypothetical protein
VAVILEDFQDIHAGATIMVCGLGPSLPLLDDPDQFITIGLNDIDAHFTPTYCLALDPQDHRLPVIASSGARAVFLGYEFLLDRLPGTTFYHPRVVTLEQGGLGIDLYGGVESTATSAIMLAIYMGAATVGLIGVDFYNAPTKRYRQWWFESSAPQRNSHFSALAEMLEGRAIHVINFSPESRLACFPKMPLKDFMEAV